MPSLYLVDGMSNIYRAYHAIQGLTNKAGFPTNAIFGFTTMLRKLIQEEKPDYLGVAIDLGGPTVRHEAYEDYKATRKPMPEDLSQQIPYILKLCEAFRIPVLSYERYEADDVIGTLSLCAVENGLDVVIVTIDKDMFQLVNKRVTVLDTRSGIHYDSEGVLKKIGVRPEQVVDVLSLVGDSSDNIPGAPGIGIKGAGKLIQEYGNLDVLLECRDDVSRKSYRESLQEHEEQIRKSRELLRIHRDLPIELNLDDLKHCSPDREKVRELLTELGFTSMLEEFLPDTREGEEQQTRLVEDSSGLETLEKEIEGEQIFVAVEFSGDRYLSDHPAWLAISHDAGWAWLLSGGFIKEDASRIAGLLAKAAGLVIHGLKPLVAFAREHRWKLPDSLNDTMLMAYLLSPNQNNFSLAQIGLEYLHYKYKQEKDRESLFDEASGQRVAEDVWLTSRLMDRLAPKIEEQRLSNLLRAIEIPLVTVLADMERRGVRVDTELLEKMSLELDSEIAALEKKIFSIAGEEFNVNSPRQLSFVLFERLNLPTSRKTGKAGHYSTGVEVLEELAISFEIAQLILDYRELVKLKNTYLDALPRLVDSTTGRIHTTYNQMVASTGRLSSSNPNLQNIPVRSELGRKIRRAFIAEPGFCILAADYSQIELRVMAHLSRDPVLVEAFKKGEDIHERTAREVFGEKSGLSPEELRRRAKVINFGILYGLSAFGLGKSLKIDRQEAQQFIDEYFERYSGVRDWISATLAAVENQGYVTTMMGRRRQIPEIYSKNWNLREFGKRTAINAPIQGTAADLIKMAMVAIHRRIQEESFQSRLIMQVHDELVLEVAETELEAMRTLLRKEMEEVVEMVVPLKVDLGAGPSWYDAKG